MNGLLRRYISKGTDISRYSERELAAVAARLSKKIRKTLDRKTSAVALEWIGYVPPDELEAGYYEQLRKSAMSARPVCKPSEGGVEPSGLMLRLE